MIISNEREANERIAFLLMEVRVNMDEIRIVASDWDIRVNVDLGEYESIAVNWDSSDADVWDSSDQSC